MMAASWCMLQFARVGATLGCLDWCVAQLEAQKQTRSRSKLVINLSLGGLVPDDTANRTYTQYTARSDVLIVAAAGE
jgi:hypothetical protein